MAAMNHAADQNRVLVEILDGHGRVNLRERVVLSEDQRVFTIGRAVDADITLDDAHAAPLHARVEIAPDGKVLVSDMASVNGLVIAGKRQRGANQVEVPDGLLQVGRTRLRIRTAHEQLAPERPDNLRPASILHDPAWLAGIGAVAGFTQLAYNTWLGVPRDLTTVLVTTLISAVAAAGIWVAFWSLLSRMLRGEWRWLRHAAIFLGVAAVFFAVNGVLELGWFVFSLPQWSTRAAWIGAIALGCALYLHLTHASNITVRRAAMIACIVPALSGGAGQWVQERLQRRDVNHIGASLRVYPPSLRWISAGTVDSYFERAAGLREAADKKRKATRADEDDSESGDDE
jgi:hypothetical protein